MKKIVILTMLCVFSFVGIQTAEAKSFDGKHDRNIKPSIEKNIDLKKHNKNFLHDKQKKDKNFISNNYEHHSFYQRNHYHHNFNKHKKHHNVYKKRHNNKFARNQKNIFYYR